MDGGLLSGKSWQYGTIGPTSNRLATHLASLELPFLLFFITGLSMIACKCRNGMQGPGEALPPLSAVPMAGAAAGVALSVILSPTELLKVSQGMGQGRGRGGQERGGKGRALGRKQSFEGKPGDRTRAEMGRAGRGGQRSGIRQGRGRVLKVSQGVGQGRTWGRQERGLRVGH